MRFLSDILVTTDWNVGWELWVLLALFLGTCVGNTVVLQIIYKAEKDPENIKKISLKVKILGALNAIAGVILLVVIMSMLFMGQEDKSHKTYDDATSIVTTYDLSRSDVATLINANYIKTDGTIKPVVLEPVTPGVGLVLAEPIPVEKTISLGSYKTAPIGVSGYKFTQLSATSFEEIELPYMTVEEYAAIIVE